MGAIRLTMLRQLMNPLSLQSERFLVAEGAESGKRVGFGQVRPLGAAAAAKTLDARPGSALRPQAQAEADADELAWEDLERDQPIQDYQ